MHVPVRLLSIVRLLSSDSWFLALSLNGQHSTVVAHSQFDCWVLGAADVSAAVCRCIITVILCSAILMVTTWHCRCMSSCSQTPPRSALRSCLTTWTAITVDM